MKKTIYLVLLINSFYSSGQNKILFGIEEISKTNFSSWSSDNYIYEGLYKFGFSEGEWELKIVITDSFISAQRITHTWVVDDQQKVIDWAPIYKTYNELRLQENKLFNSKGELLIEFLTFRNKVESPNLEDFPDSINGIIFYKSLKPEFGNKNQDFTFGEYPETYWKTLKIEDLEGLDKKRLQIMRNEIFARYGYKFRANSKMDLYFRKQEWYKARYENVREFFTNIEKVNIELIKNYEKTNQ